MILGPAKSVGAPNDEGKMALVICRSGIVSELSEDRVEEAPWNEGCIHIRRREQSVTMSVNFNRLTVPAIAAALYELGDMRPKQICLAVGESGIAEVLVGFEAALHRICEVFANANVREECTDIPLPFSRIGRGFEQDQSGNEVIGRHGDRDRSVPDGRSGTDG
jgi:hypothetical protein